MKRLLIGLAFMALFFGMASVAMADYYRIRDDVTGGDCSLIGIWDLATKTCTLTIDLTDSISIENDGITVDGNGHSLISSNHYWDVGIYIPHKKNVTVKNCTIKQFWSAFFVYYSTNSNIFGNIMVNNYYGLYLFASPTFNLEVQQMRLQGASCSPDIFWALC
ncbi:MAG: right-handed parallel beta-helix repeat-containing protein [Nitrospirae bacterium]|nr:right-handed parallel beta-helix repeat-containing protein [Nitrospirota bacterium]